MRLSNLTLHLGVMIGAALVSIAVAWLAEGVIERGAQAALEERFSIESIDWATIEADGLRVALSGTAPSEAERFRALTVAGSVVDSNRVEDRMQVMPSAPIRAPRFSIEILRNDQGISLIGLIPAETDRVDLTERIRTIADNVPVTDLMDSAAYPVPETWDESLDFGLAALARLERSKISIEAGTVTVIASSNSREEKRAAETALTRQAPDGVEVVLDIQAPRPVITPFTLRFVIDEEGARFDACSAHTEQGRDSILAAAAEAGVPGTPTCTLGLGVPSPDWPQAATLAIGAVSRMGGGSVTLSDADVTLVAPPEVPLATFETIAAELEADLPEVFSLHAVEPQVVSVDGEAAGPPEFTATLSPEGQVQLRGRLTDDRQRSAAESFARAKFGIDSVYAATKLDDTLPLGWSTRVLAGIEALSFLSNGAVIVQPTVVTVTGKTGIEDASAEISRILSEKLGEAEDFRVNVTYVESLDPIADMPTAEECVASINQILETEKITFDPGSSDIVAGARATLDKIADVLKTCPDVHMEIAGYTDSQGREEMNKNLSQSRAQAVLNGLLARRVLTSNLVAVGYGEADPIADNSTEEGREANRRIEFHLITDPEAEAAEGEGAEGEAVEGEAAETAAAAATNPDATSEDTDEAAGDEAGEAETPNDDPVDDTIDDGTADEAEAPETGDTATGDDAAEAVTDAPAEEPADTPADGAEDTTGDTGSE